MERELTMCCCKEVQRSRQGYSGRCTEFNIYFAIRQATKRVEVLSLENAIGYIPVDHLKCPLPPSASLRGDSFL